jgi:hypothetical protein
VIFPHIAVRTPILPKRDLNYRSRLAGYEPDDQTLSPVDSIALISMRPPKDPQNGLVLDPSWTLESRESATLILNFGAAWKPAPLAFGTFVSKNVRRYAYSTICLICRG